MKETYEVGPGRTVTVTIQVDDAPSTYDANKAAEVMAENYTRAAGRNQELEKSLAESRELVAFKTRVNDEIEGDLIKAREATGLALNERNRLARRVAELERALGNSIDRENKLETQRVELETHHRMSLAARDRLLETATRKVSAAVELLTAGAVAEARENIVTSRGAVLADAIGNTLRVLDRA